MSTFEYGAGEAAVVEEETDEPAEDYDSVVRSVSVQKSTNGSGYPRHRSVIPAAIVEELEIEKGDTLMMETRPDGTFIVDPK